MENEDMAGRIMAHAFWEELEKVATAKGDVAESTFKRVKKWFKAPQKSYSEAIKDQGVNTNKLEALERAILENPTQFAAGGLAAATALPGPGHPLFRKDTWRARKKAHALVDELNFDKYKDSPERLAELLGRKGSIEKVAISKNLLQRASVLVKGRAKNMKNLRHSASLGVDTKPLLQAQMRGNRTSIPRFQKRPSLSNQRVLWPKPPPISRL